MAEEANQTSAEGVRWDLSRLFADVTAAEAALAEAVRRSEALLARVPAVEHLDPAGLRQLLDEASELAAFRDLLDERWGYAGLRLLADSSDLEARDLTTQCEVSLATLRDALRAVALAVGARPPDLLDRELEPYRHWLEHQGAVADNRLELAAEQAFAARTGSASTAWGRLSQEILIAASVPFDAGDGEQPHGVVELKLLRYHADREIRRRASETLTGIYEENLPVAAACLDAIVADRLVEDRLRGRDDPMEATLVVDEVDRATVEHLLAAVESSTGMLERWYERKRAALGIERLEPYDRFAPVGDAPVVSWPAAVDACCSVFEELASTLEPVARRLFDDRRVDAERRAGKDGAIFCAPFPAGGSFVFLSYLDSAIGAIHLGHELGHAVHFDRGALGTPWLSVMEPASAAFIEVPSTFAELAVAEHLQTTIGGEQGRAAMRQALEGAFVLVFEVAAATRFEQAICARRLDGQTLTPERVDELWLEHERAIYGNLAQRLSVLNFPHTFIARFYGYQYAYATLAALGLRVIRRNDPERFAADYVGMLDAMGTGTPAQLLARCGLDIEDPDVWRSGLEELDRMCEAAW